MNPKLLAEAAARTGQLAQQLTPDERDECAVSLKLAIFHLRSAAKILRETAEFKASHEQTPAATG